MSKCLYCYQGLNGEEVDFHERCSLQFFRTKQPPRLEYTLDNMAELAKEVVARHIAVPGVQPKLSMAMSGQEDPRLTIVGELGGNYIFKPPYEAFPEMPANEHVTMRFAETFGLQTVSSSLIRLKSGELAYLTKRVDRGAQQEKSHMLDMFQITEAFNKYRSSMEKVGKALGMYSDQPLLDQLYLFELTVFSFLSGNNDMHLKNFSMLETEMGWALAPAYDLLNVTILLPEDTEELALTIEGKKSRFTKAHFERFGAGLGLNEKQIRGVFRRFEKNKGKAMEWLERSFLSEGAKEAYREVLEKRYERLR